jgi:hypothetical protein
MTSINNNLVTGRETPPHAIEYLRRRNTSRVNLDALSRRLWTLSTFGEALRRPFMAGSESCLGCFKLSRYRAYSTAKPTFPTMKPKEIELTVPETHDRLMAIVTASLDEAGIDYSTEHWLDDDSRVDVFYDGIVLEVKSIVGVIDDDKLDRYESHEDVDEVVLVMPEAMARREARRERRIISIDRATFTLSLGS